MADPDVPTPDDALVLDPDCRRCPALVDARDRIAWGNGPTDAAVVVVGEAPAEGRELDGFIDSVLDPVDALGTTVVPLLHPSYADVWRSRLGYDREGYRAALAATLRDCGIEARVQ